jgi:hypothetical protein
MILLDEAVRKAKEFAEKKGWLVHSEDIVERSRLIPSVWKIDFIGDHLEFEIDVNAETGEIFDWDFETPLSVGIQETVQRFKKAAEDGYPLSPEGLDKVLMEEHKKAYQKYTERLQHAT